MIGGGKLSGGPVQLEKAATTLRQAARGDDGKVQRACRLLFTSCWWGRAGNRHHSHGDHTMRYTALVNRCYKTAVDTELPTPHMTLHSACTGSSVAGAGVI